jgi:Alginate export
MRIHLPMIRRLVVMLGAVLWTFWFIPISSGGNDEAQDSPPEDQSRLKSASEIIARASQRVQDSPKQFKDYFQEKVAQAEQEPWRETADEILIDPGQGRQRTLGTYGIRYFRSAEMNQFDYEGESAFQEGTRNGLDHFAHLQHIQIGYTFDLPLQPHVIVQYDYASGTSDPTSGKSGTFDTLFGARRPEYSPTSIFGPFFRSNISSPGIRIETQTLREVDLILKWRAWYLAQVERRMGWFRITGPDRSSRQLSRTGCGNSRPLEMGDLHVIRCGV